MSPSKTVDRLCVCLPGSGAQGRYAAAAASRPLTARFSFAADGSPPHRPRLRPPPALASGCLAAFAALAPASRFVGAASAANGAPLPARAPGHRPTSPSLRPSVAARLRAQYGTVREPPSDPTRLDPTTRRTTRSRASRDSRLLGPCGIEPATPTPQQRCRPTGYRCNAVPGILHSYAWAVGKPVPATPFSLSPPPLVFIFPTATGRGGAKRTPKREEREIILIRNENVPRSKNTETRKRSRQAPAAPEPQRRHATHAARDFPFPFLTPPVPSQESTPF